MIHEYAIEPELVATWGNWNDYRYFYHCFGLETGRIISRLPKKWKKLVYDSINTTNAMEKMRVEELIKQLSITMVKRGPNIIWNDNEEWLDNVIKNHEQFPFHAILARSNPRENDSVLLNDNLEPQNKKWRKPTGLPVYRTAAEIVNYVKPLLMCSEKWVLVAPHFDLSKEWYFNTFKEIMALLQTKNIVETKHIEVYIKDTGISSVYEKNHGRYLSKTIPTGFDISFIFLQELKGGEEIHNRYIMTELGGISLGKGPDEGQPGQTDDFQILPEEIYNKRWEQFLLCENYYKKVDSVKITGKA